MSSFVDIKGKTLVCNGRTMRFRGTNIGNWLNIEGFMIGVPYVDYKMREIFAEQLGEGLRDRFFASYLDNYLTEGDFRVMAATGFNLLRLPFNYRRFESDLDPGRYDPKGFDYLDRAVRWGKKHGVYILFDFHAAPGSQSEDWHSDNATIEPRFWEVKDFQTRATALWKEIARRYRNEETVMGYDLLNEPNTTHHDRLNAFYAATIRAIRSVDKNHVIVVEGSRWSDDIFSLDVGLFKDRRTMPSFHHYPFFGIRRYPGVHNGKRCDRRRLLASMKDKFAFHDRVGRPMLLGECGFTTRTRFNGPFDVLRDLLTVMESKGIHWTLWSFKDIGAMGFVSPGPDTPWIRFIRRDDITRALRQRYQIWSKMRTVYKNAYDAIDEKVRTRAIKQMARGIEHLELYHFLRVLKKRGKKAIATMPESFHIDCCVPNQRAARLMKEFLQN